MKLLVTGGAGFIGSAVCREIVGNSEDAAINVDKLTYAANLQSLSAIAGSGRYRFHQADICDRPAIDRILAREEPDAILHLAAESHVDRSITGPADFISTNILGTFTMLEAARAYCESLGEARRATFRFLHVSTDEVYGSLGADGAFDEETPYRPNSPYSASKAASDHLVRAWFHTYGLPAIISNCSNNYGPYHFPEKLIPLAITNAIDELEVAVYGKGDNVRDWLHVEDHARALLHLVKKGRPGRNYNIGGRAERRNIEVVETICDCLDRLRPRAQGASHRELIRHVADRPGHDLRYAIDPSRVEHEIGWRCTETFDSGLEKTVHWFLDNEDWWRPLKSRIYDVSRLGLREAAQ